MPLDFLLKQQVITNKSTSWMATAGISHDEENPNTTL